MRTRDIIKKPKYLIVFSIFMFICMFCLLYGTILLEKKFSNKMLNISTKDVIAISNNTSRLIDNLLKDDEDYIEQIEKHPLLHSKIEQILSILITENIKYSYLVYRDKNKVFRFIADGSPYEDKSLMNQKFDVDNPKWIKIYDEKKPELIKQSYLHQLSITYLVPIMQDGEVKLILSIDFSINKIEDINNLINVIKYTISAIIFIIFLTIIALIIQTIKYLSAKNRAYIDNLTKTYNRNYLQELTEFINLNDYILATIDVDYFKKVNDTYGHDVGDKVLKQTSAIIKSAIRTKEDTVVRYGGEEFLLLIKTKRDNKFLALNTIERVFTKIQESRFKISKNEYINITVSIGVNINPGKSRTFHDAFKLSDIALYNAKNKGRNNIEIYSNNNDANTSLMTINDVKDAIEEKRVVCFYQKIIDNKTKQLSHYEALLRIIDKNQNIITPNKILPVIKGTFISRNITKCVLDICYKKLLQEPTININVNLNPQDIISDSILAILKEYAKDKTLAIRLGIEIVETEDIINYKEAKKNLLMLKKLGYKIFIDDFGSGYSNFIYLTEINTDYIKIDGNIIKKILEDNTSYLVVKNIVNFAKEANIKVIAEYVSTKEIYEKVKALEIEYSQGYYFHEPEDLK